MPLPKAILTVQREDFRVDLLTKPPQSALFRICLVRKLLAGESKLVYSSAMLLIGREGSDSDH